MLIWKDQIARKLSLFLISFAAGVLLGVAFLDLLPEALEEIANPRSVVLIVVSAIVVVFVMEKFLWWYHHHRIHAEEHSGDIEHPEESGESAKAYLLMIGDTLHNFVDGVLIAAAFLADFSLGVAVSIGVIAHELPQEISDFSVMLHVGFSKTKTLLLNTLSASVALVGAILAFFILPTISGAIPFAIAFSAGTFIYISLSDLIPEIHHRSEHQHNFIHFLLFIAGIILIGWVV